MIFLWALTPPTPDLLHGGLGCSSAVPHPWHSPGLVAASCPGGSLPFFCFSPLPQGPLPSLGGMGVVALEPEPCSGPSGWEGRVCSSLPCLLSALHLLVGRDFPKRRETLKGSGVSFFAFISTLSSTEGRAEQQCRTVPQPVQGPVGTSGTRLRRGQHPAYGGTCLL